MTPITKSTLFSRKQFLKLTAVLLSLYPLKLFYDVSKTRRTGSGKNKQQILSMDLPEGISFHGDIIAVQKEGSPVFLSAQCPHLGCQINRQTKGQLVCPCHGSRFSLQGKIIEGPAAADLTVLSSTTNINTRQYTILLSN
jgi:Rieske Fe-S protein